MEKNQLTLDDKDTLKDKLGFIFLNQEYTDLVLRIGPSRERIKCHRIMLIVNSPVFRTMFRDQWVGASSDVKEIGLPNDDRDTFVEFLHFLYTEDFRNPNMSTFRLISIFCIAEKYDVKKLWFRCIDLLKTRLETDKSDVLMIYFAAKLHRAESLETSCADIICSKAQEVFFDGALLDLDEPELRVILEMDGLNISEVLLFRAVIGWAEEKCNIAKLELNGPNLRKVLGDSLYRIRFPLFSVEDFNNHVECNDLLTVDEKYSILLMIVTPNLLRSVLAVGKFSAEPRAGSRKGEKPVPVYTLKRFNEVMPIPTVGKTRYSDSELMFMSFQVNRPIRITSIGLFGPAHQRCNYEATVELADSDRNVFASVRQLSSLVGVGDIFQVVFPNPIHIDMNTVYSIALTVKGPDTQRGNPSNLNCAVECGNELVKFSFEEYNNTCFSSSLVSEICFEME